MRRWCKRWCKRWWNGRRSWLGASALAALLSNPLAAGAFGARGHQVIGAVADRLLTPHAARQVSRALGMPLRVAATWADCVKDVIHDAPGFHYEPDPRFAPACGPFETRAGVPRMVDYVQRNWSNCGGPGEETACHRAYHYTDVAIQRDRYDRAFVGTFDHDIVGALEAAIGVLQGRPAPAPFSIRDRTEALLLLAHLVGDVHQPLHVGAIYLDARGRPVDPDASAPRVDPQASGTRGGNSIGVGSSDLHADWDRVAGSLNATPVAPGLLAAAKAVAPAPGPVARWPAVWAGETVRVSRAAFEGITFRPVASRPGRWSARFDDRAAYLRMKRRVQAEQLARAGARLAQVLNAVWP